MANITSKGMIDLLYLKKLPKVYRDEDSKIGFPLKRYLESLIEGGYSNVIEDIEGAELLTDPMTVPDKFFPYLCESFGLTYFPDIDISYQRKFLANIGELNKRRGTYASVRYLIRALTGLDCDISHEGEYLNITLLAKDLNQLNSIGVSTKVIEAYITSQVPFFVTPKVSSRLESFIINSVSYSSSAVGYHKFYTIK